MNRPHLIRRIKITWTAFCGLACLLLLVLWLWSYEKIKVLERTSKNEIATDIISDSGTLTLSRYDLKRNESFLPPEAHGWRYEEYEPNVDRSVSRFAFDCSAAELTIRAPDWCPLVLFAFSAALPWIRWRFT